MSYRLYDFGAVVHRDQMEPSGYEVGCDNASDAQHVRGVRVVSPGDVTKTPHVATVFWSNPLPGICGSLAVLAGPEAGLAVWVFLRVA